MVADQLAMFMPDSDWSPPESLPNLSDTKVISIDVETKDPNLKALGPGWARNDGHIVGYGIAADRDQGWYLPVRHEGGGNLDPAMIKRFVNDLTKSPDRDVIMFHSTYDIGWLQHEGIQLNGRVIDPYMGAVLADEHRWSYSLDSLLKSWCHEEKDETLLQEAARALGVDAKSGMWKMPSCFVGPYGEQDAKGNFMIWSEVKKRLDAEDLWQVFDLECELAYTWVDMSRRGVRIDLDWVEQVRARLVKKEKEAQKQIKALCGRTVEVWVATDIAKGFEAVGVTEYPLTPKTKQPSFTQAWLQTCDHPLAHHILQARKMNKARGTFLDSMVLEKLTGDHLHPSWHPLRDDDYGAVSGRVTASNPSPQVIPKRDPDLGPLIRGCFIPEEGCTWDSHDYSQQEPRWTVHYAAERGHDKADEAVALYKDNPDTDYHQALADMCGVPHLRRPIKDINLGLAYNLGRDKLIYNLGLLGVDGEDIYDQYHDNVPFVRQLNQDISRMADRRGWVRTVLGRRSRFPLWEPKGNYKGKEGWVKPCELWLARKKVNQGERGWSGAKLVRAWTYRAMNRVIQGTSADQTKQAIRDLSREGLLVSLQIHDELCRSNGGGTKERKLVSEIMEHTMRARVPFRVEVEHGPRWLQKEEE